MRLLNVNTYELSDNVIDFNGESRRAYATLSHTWGDDELSFQDIGSDGLTSKPGFAKIRGCCEQAKKDGIEWVWIDTCCIDKTNSAELSEAINSMYAWYHRSTVCYVYLVDVPPRDPYIDAAKFSKARWFTRGWCLQELIAPPKVEFYARDWSEIGTKWSLQDIIKKTTSIPTEVLLYGDIAKYSVAQKLSWAANRKTTRTEDEAYCLLGIFDIHMPLIYGEGRKSFLRLQNEILQRTEDYSFLIWTAALHRRREAGLGQGALPVLAISPSFFLRTGPILRSSTGRRCLYEDLKPFYASRDDFRGMTPLSPLARHPPQPTSRGLRMQMFVCPSRDPPQDSESGNLLLWTEYMFEDSHVCIVLTENRTRGFVTYDRAMASEIITVKDKELPRFQIKELYLTSNNHTYESQPRRVLTAPRELEVIVSSRPGCENISLGLMSIYPPAESVRSGNGQPLIGQQIRVENVENTMAHFKTGSGNWSLSLGFRVSKHDVIDDEKARDPALEVVVINLWLEPAFPRCHVWVSDDPKAVIEDEGKSARWIDERNHDKATDRAETEVLRGDALMSISIKSQEKLAPQPDERKLTFFTVNITLFKIDDKDRAFASVVADIGLLGSGLTERRRSRRIVSTNKLTD